MSRCPNPFQQSQLNRAAKFWKSEIKESDIEIGRRRERQLIAEAEAFADAHRKPMGREDWEEKLKQAAGRKKL